MGHGHEHHGQAISLADRAAEAQRATWISVLVNLVMTLAQLLIGWLAHSQSLIAHGLHSFSDLLSDFLVLYATHQSAHPADPDHPYGHARFETAATLILGLSLTAVGGSILWESGLRLQHLDTLPSIDFSALWMAIATVLAKEGLYRYLILVGERQRSQLLIANALHTRADAASALVVVVGIGGALQGWAFLDLLAAALMGFMILRMGFGLAWDALKELIDTGLNETQLEPIRATLLATSGVRGLHGLRTRRMAHQVLVDAHVLVDSRISVSEGHRIAETARARVLHEHPEVLDVLVHIDPEDDLLADMQGMHLPSRETLLHELAPLLEGMPQPERIVLHYLNGGVEVELHYALGHFPDVLALDAAEQMLSRRLDQASCIKRLRIHGLNAPMR